MIKKLLLLTFILVSVSVLAQAPILKNFRIENTNKNRVYFDSDENLSSGSTYSGFIISGKTISGVSINSESKTGHYFTVTSAFTFWDNNTIRYEGGSNLKDSEGEGLDEFSLTYIENIIVEPEATTQTLYVVPGGAGTRSGSNESNAMTFNNAYAKASSGTTIWVKKGVYNIDPSNLNKTASSSNPIKIMGYDTTIKDLNGVDYYSYVKGSYPDGREAPLIVSSSSSDWSMNGAYHIIRNLQAEDFDATFYVGGTGYYIDNCVTINNPNGFYIGGTKNRVSNSIGINSDTHTFVSNGDFNLMVGNRAYCDNNGPTTDYYFAISNSDNCIALNNLAKRVDDVGHPGHAFSLQTATGAVSYSRYNLVENHKGINCVKAVELRHVGVAYNVIRGLQSYGENDSGFRFKAGGIIIRDASHDNIIENCYINIAGTEDSLRFEESDETIGHGLGDNNLIRNNIFSGGARAIVFSSDNGSATGTGNLVYNNTFYDSGTLFHHYEGGLTNISCEFKNNIVLNVSSLGDSKGWNLDSNNIYDSWANSLGSNSINENPKFDSEFTPTNKALKAGTPLFKVPYDARKEIRSSVSPTIGAFEIVDERVGSVVPDMSICKGENAILIASGGTSYDWNTGETTASITVSPTESTTYTVTVSNGIDSDLHNVVVTVNEAPTVDAGSDVSLCSGEAITLTATGIGDFLWSNGETTASITVNPTETTTYSVTASNSCNIEVTDDVIVTVTPGINLTTTDDIEVCIGETDIILTADSNGDYLWSTGETTPTITVNPTSTTTYTITSTLGDCSITDEVVVTVNEAPTVNAGSDVSLCSGEAVTLTATGIGNFLWSNGETTPSITVNPTETTTYSVTASNSCNIEVTDDVIVTITPGINLTTTDDIEVCIGETDIILTADSNGDYLWSTGETTPTITVNPTSTTTYTITSTLGDCSKADEVIVTVNEAPTVNAGSDVSLCSGEAVTLTATGIGNFLWSNGETTPSITVSPTETTTYSVTASNSCSDPVSDEVIVNVTSAITLDAGIDVTLCSGESTTLTATSNGNILWSTGESSASIVVNPSTTTTYSVTSSSGECSLTDEVIVTINNLPSVSLGEDTKICIGESVTLTAVGTGNFLWSTGETTSSITVNPTVSTTYTVTASTSCSEPVSDAIIVTVNNLPVIDASSDVTIANGSSTVLTATGDGNFLWSTGETSSSVTVNPTSTTTYTVTLTSLEGCSSQDNVIVTVSDNPVTTVNIDAVPDQNICLNESVTLIATGGTNYLWSTGETTASITVSPTETTIFAVTISNGNTVQVDDITIFVDETCSGIANRSINKESKIYPNPTQGQLNIELSGFNDESNISVFDLNGRLVYSENIDNYSPIKILKRQLNLSRFGKGIYFVRLINKTLTETKKVLVI